MITPSISFNPAEVQPMWRFLTVEGVKNLIRNDIAEINRYLQLQAEDEAACVGNRFRTPDYRIPLIIKAWDRIQDTHWSWFQEILNANTAATVGPSGLGSAVVGSGGGEGIV